LFIRETTSLTDHTFRFAKKAESESMIVIDDPTSIMRCTNKIYLADLLRTHKIPSPKTIIITRDQKNAIDLVAQEVGFPAVLKIPDGSFSRGVLRVEKAEDFQAKADQLLKQSALLLVQEDRKSTRLNSSHVKISYAVFCLKKKNRVESVDGTELD